MGCSQQSVYESGWTAFSKGQSIDDCPYNKSDSRLAWRIDIWQQGWLDAQADSEGVGLTQDEELDP